MNLGALVVQMNADSKALAKGMREGIREVEQAVAAMKKLSREVAQAGMGITAFFAGMVKAAATVDFGVKKSLDNLKDSFLTLAVQIANMVMPAIRQLTQLLRDVANWFAGLPSSTRAAISDFALFALKAGALALAFGKLMGLVQALVGVFSGFAAVVGAIGAGGLAAIVLGIAAILTVVAVLHKAWRTNWHGIRDVTKQVIETIAGWWGKFASFLGTIWSAIVDDMASKVKAVIALVLKVMTMTGKMDERTAGLIGGAARTAVDTAAGVAKSPMAMKTIALEGAKLVKEGALDLKKELIMAGKEIRDALGLGSSGKGAAGVSSSKVGRGGEVEKYSDAIERAIAHSLDKPQRVQQTAASRTSGATRDSSAEFWKGMEEMGPMMSRLIGPLKQFATELGTALLESVSNVSGALGFAGNFLASKMGELGQVINSVVQGAQSGGVWGALAAFIIEMMSRVERFKEILAVGMGQLEIALSDLAGPLNTLISAFKQLMGGIGVLAKALHPIIGFVINIVARVFKHLTPIFVLIGKLIEPLGAFLSSLETIMGLFDMLIPVFDILNFVLSIVGITILSTVLGVSYVWNGIIEAVAALLDAFKQHGAAAEVRKAKVNTKSMEDQIKAMADGMFKQGLTQVADESAAAAEEIGNMKEAAKEATEQLLNVPQGYKIAFDRLMATAATSSTGGGAATLAFDEGRKAFLQTGNPARKRFYGYNGG